MILWGNTLHTSVKGIKTQMLSPHKPPILTCVALLNSFVDFRRLFKQNVPFIIAHQENPTVHGAVKLSFAFLYTCVFSLLVMPIK